MSKRRQKSITNDRPQGDDTMHHADHVINEFDTMDAGKYLGYMGREWPSKFGSMPAYDDFGDESGPD